MMITLRGKLTRTPADAKPATPAIARINLAPAGFSSDPRSAAAAERGAAAPPESAEPRSEATRAVAEPSPAEEWLWRGVWAFGSLPEGDAGADALAGARAPAPAGTASASAPAAGARAANEGKGEERVDGGAAAPAADSERWIDRLTCRIAEVAKQPSTEGNDPPPVEEASSAPADSAALNREAASAAASAETAEGEPRPFCYRFVKIVDARDVFVPSSLIAIAEEEERAEHVVGTADAKTGGDRATSVGEATAQQPLPNEAPNSSEAEPSSENAPAARAPSDHTKLPRHDSKVAEKEHADSADGTAAATTQNPHKIEQPPTSTASTQPPTPAPPNPPETPNLKPPPKKQTYGDPPYAEAHPLHPTACPPGGRWEGHFENIAPGNATKKRRDAKRDANRIREMFYLFFNSDPPPGARTKFVSDETTGADEKSDSAEAEEEAALPEGRVHVRGYGTNRFGTFEIVGSFDLESGVLHCQRMYVQTPPPESTSKKHSKRSSTGQFSSGGGRVGRPPAKKDGEGKRGRKRKPSLKKRTMDSFGSLEGVDVANLGGALDIASIVKKRARLSVDGGSAAPAAPAPQCRGDAVEAAKPHAPAPKLAPSLKASSAKASKPKKKRAPSLKDASASRCVPPPVDVEPLPSEGDPFLARWRAAHFLYYRRVEAAEGGEAPASAANSGKVSCVVYEGEMIDGYREGMGICLYANDTMYEGQWKKNKEHGKGTLMTPDRSKIIYQGDWERGRMHGNGAYYYHKDVSLGRGSVGFGKDMGHYVGEFRENLRNGRGVYSFPDGSIYEGEWRDNTPNGWGVFRWPDDSVFQGMWKDGRRHGNNGTLIVSDGFRYEGAWVDNAMEGRGVATYPNGQVYEGMWVAGRREGRGTIRFTNGAIYEGRFRDDNMEGQGTMKMSRNVLIPPHSDDLESEDESKADRDGEPKKDWMIPIEFQSDISHIHQKAGFTQVGL